MLKQNSTLATNFVILNVKISNIHTNFKNLQAVKNGKQVRKKNENII